MKLEDKNIVVTGGAGFIGSNIANSLAEDNNVLVIDNEYLGDPKNLNDECRYLELDVRDFESKGGDIDVLFHLAALSSYKMHEEETVNGADVNINGFINMVQECMDSGCDQVVYATTSSIYGSRTEPSPENMDVAVNTAYEASKVAREKYAEYFHNHHDINLAGMRFFSVYEGYESGSEEHKGEYANVIAQFADSIVNDEPPVLYGDGTQTRDFTHVDDIVRACALAAENELNGIYNVGTGRQVSFNKLVDMLGRELCNVIDPEYVENPIPESVYVHDTMADYSKLEEETGWKPTISLEEGIVEVCRAYR